MNVKINKNRFRYNKKNYYRRGAHELSIGSYGRRDLINGMSHYSVVKGLEDVPMKVVTTINLEQLSKSELDIILEGKSKYTSVNGAAEVEISRNQISNRDLSLYCLSVRDLNRLVYAMNNDSACLRYMQQNKTRIVDIVWVILEARFEEELKKKGNLKVDASGISSAVNLSASVRGSNQKETNLKISPNSIFAYRLQRPRFKGKKREGLVMDFRPDYKGII